MGFVLSARWLEQVYRGALIGAQDQLWANSSLALFATLRWGGAYVVVRWLSPTIFAYFVWQLAVSVLSSAVLASRTHQSLKSGIQRGQFSYQEIKKVFGFARGVFLGAVLSFLLMQVDKIALSKYLRLDEFGIYMLASTVASGLLQVAIPMNTVIIPQLTRYAGSGEWRSAGKLYVSAATALSAILVPIASLLIFFPRETILVWSGDHQLADSASDLLSLLALGTLFNATMNPSYSLQIACGWTSLTVFKNLIAAIVVIPLLFVLIPRFGSSAAAVLWITLNASYLLVEPTIVHRRLLVSDKWNWYFGAVIAPMAASGSAMFAARFVLGYANDRPGAAVLVAIALCLAYLCTFLSVPLIRRQMSSALIGFWH
jgi:O-antigen/teichoic acid export membrane protein